MLPPLRIKQLMMPTPMPRSKPRQLTFADAINEATDQLLKKYPEVFVVGLGVPDPKGIFGTTLGLQQKYGSHRVMDMPVSENAMTGVCIGASLRGMRPILTHQRVDFSMLSFDQIINNAAKWYFMFGSQQSVPLVIRMIIGRGWGQGPQHSQSLQALFAHIPGLIVLMPTTAQDAKGLLVSAVENNNPVVILEHRWLFNLVDQVPSELYRTPIGKAHIMHPGNEITVVAASYAAIECLQVAKIMTPAKISVEVVDLRTVRPLDIKTIINSVTKTRRLLVVDTGWVTGGISAEIITQVVEHQFNALRTAPLRLGLPDIPTPTTPALTKNFYPGPREIAQAVLQLTGKKADLNRLFPQSQLPHDIPDNSFTGPF
ncbi:MAG: pyruvate dehydrogenase E1 component subunit beta [Candidatus Gottesmanbacteria bacterium GW2011_GWA1_43_11]|uniref:Pyruvate dehydrogenase E1 component subunit beta n=1 Tax=Candidatus Gottesmanbacteria bacterium GW2011_GWA1_43_11 TaxID=1618436 RepID=A0A0G1CIV9_9BACT|nr:MAG: pyruvate dehydrogenase E1 component subunit beta [Candidatus Gottesmanbacteria bacterium GW2011_GWA1_43_11]